MRGNKRWGQKGLVQLPDLYTVLIPSEGNKDRRKIREVFSIAVWPKAVGKSSRISHEQNHFNILAMFSCWLMVALCCDALDFSMQQLGPLLNHAPCICRSKRYIIMAVKPEKANVGDTENPGMEAILWDSKAYMITILLQLSNLIFILLSLNFLHSSHVVSSCSYSLYHLFAQISMTLINEILPLLDYWG